MSETVAHSLVDALEKIGVTHIFGLIADSLDPIGDAVGHSKIEWIGVRHEEGAALAAAGQAELTGRLGVCCGSAGPGSTHLIAGLYEACGDHAPVLALSGQMPRQLQGIDRQHPCLPPWSTPFARASSEPAKSGTAPGLDRDRANPGRVASRPR